MKFDYEGFDSRGNTRKGKVDAPNEPMAREAIAEMGITPISVKRNQDVQLPWQNRPPNLKDKAAFTQNLGQLLGTGVPIDEAIPVASRSTVNMQLHTAAEQLQRELRNGEDIVLAIQQAKYSKIFDPIFIAFVQLGKETGDIGGPLRELGGMYRWQLKMVGLMRKGLVLPAIIAVLCMAVTYYLMVYIVPNLMGMLVDLNAELPAITAAVKAVSEFLTRPTTTILLLAMIFITIPAFARYRATPAGRRQVDQLTLRLPIIGPLSKTYILALMCRALALTTRNGVPLNIALNITANVVDNSVYREHLHDMRVAFEAGEPMYQVLLAAPKHFPEAFTAQFKVGETRNMLTSTLDYVSGIYMDEVQAAAEAIGSAIEPIMIVFLGGVVGVIVLSVFLPMGSIMGSIGR